MGIAHGLFLLLFVGRPDGRQIVVVGAAGSIGAGGLGFGLIGWVLQTICKIMLFLVCSILCQMQTKSEVCIRLVCSLIPLLQTNYMFSALLVCIPISLVQTNLSFCGRSVCNHAFLLQTIHIFMAG